MQWSNDAQAEQRKPVSPCSEYRYYGDLLKKNVTTFGNFLSWFHGFVPSNHMTLQFAGKALALYLAQGLSWLACLQGLQARVGQHCPLHVLQAN